MVHRDESDACDTGTLLELPIAFYICDMDPPFSHGTPLYAVQVDHFS